LNVHGWLYLTFRYFIDYYTARLQSFMLGVSPWDMHPYKLV